MRKWFLLMVAGGLLFVATTLLLAQKPGELGLEDGALRRCGVGDACVNSQFGDGDQRVLPLYVGQGVDAAWKELKAILQADSSATVQVSESHYLRVAWTQPLIPYVNDLEFLRFDAGGLIHVRAEARVGFMAFGSHIKQLERLRQALAMGAADGS